MTTNDVEVLRGEIISIGTEILLGALTDTNANHLASQLPAIGIGNYRVTTVRRQPGPARPRLSRGMEPLGRHCRDGRPRPHGGRRNPRGHRPIHGRGTLLGPNARKRTAGVL